ncbi:hypothetical protein [Streptomyces sp. BH105]|uniref:hypothetical protein n=1 Tax=Streptomyces sp. BH105 TaxID=3410408 RepID=UPI003CF28D9D
MRTFHVMSTDAANSFLSAATPSATARHHHAYRWTGTEWPSDGARTDPRRDTPPQRFAQWLTKPQSMQAAWFPEPREALRWLLLQLDALPPAGREFDESSEKQLAVVNLTAGRGVPWVYRTAGGEIVVLAVVPCPQVGFVCPGASG